MGTAGIVAVDIADTVAVDIAVADTVAVDIVAVGIVVADIVAVDIVVDIVAADTAVVGIAVCIADSATAVLPADYCQTLLLYSDFYFQLTYQRSFFRILL